MHTYNAVFSPSDSSFPAKLGLSFEHGVLSRVDYLSCRAKEHIPANILISNIVEQFQHYFSEPTMSFDIPLHINGTDHGKRVWQQLLRIPAGKVRTYGTIAQRVNSSARAVGNACRSNPMPLVIPCHRVVAKNGLGGFSGKTSGRMLEVKRWLLSHEGYSC